MNEHSRQLHVRMSKEDNRQIRELMELFGENSTQVMWRAISMLHQSKFGQERKI